MANKKKRPQELIEATARPKLEQAYVKFPGREMVYVGKNETEESTRFDHSKIRKQWKHNNRSRYTQLHTHPVPLDHQGLSEEMYMSLPSSADIYDFLVDDNEETMVVAQTNAENSKLNGYFILRKTKKTPKSGITKIPGLLGKLKNIFVSEQIPKEIKDSMNEYHIYSERSAYDNSPYSAEGGMRRLAERMSLQYRFVPASEKQVYTGRMPTRRRTILGLIAAAFLLTSILMSQKAITGNVIGLSNQTFSLVALWFFISGLITGYFYLKNKKQR